MVRFEHSEIRLPSFCGGLHVALGKWRSLQRDERLRAFCRPMNWQNPQRSGAGSTYMGSTGWAAARRGPMACMSSRNKLHHSLVPRPFCLASRMAYWPNRW